MRCLRPEALSRTLRQGQSDSREQLGEPSQHQRQQREGNPAPKRRVQQSGTHHGFGQVFFQGMTAGDLREFGDEIDAIRVKQPYSKARAEVHALHLYFDRLAAQFKRSDALAVWWKVVLV